MHTRMHTPSLAATLVRGATAKLAHNGAIRHLLQHLFVVIARRPAETKATAAWALELQPMESTRAHEHVRSTH